MPSKKLEIIQFCTIYSHLPSLYLIILNNQVDQLSPPSHKSTWLTSVSGYLYLTILVPMIQLEQDGQDEKGKGKEERILPKTLTKSFSLQSPQLSNRVLIYSKYLSNTNTFNLTSHKNIRNSSYFLLNISCVSSTMLYYMLSHLLLPTNFKAGYKNLERFTCSSLQIEELRIRCRSICFQEPKILTTILFYPHAFIPLFTTRLRKHSMHTHMQKNEPRPKPYNLNKYKN